jgi:hypothetical protein
MDIGEVTLYSVTICACALEGEWREGRGAWAGAAAFNDDREAEGCANEAFVRFIGRQARQSFG